MKQALLLLLLIGIGVWAYFHYWYTPTQAEAPQEAHLARQGTFFVLEYVSVPGPHGIIGFEPGREVRFVRADRAKGLLVVSDGIYEVEMKPSQLTNDLDIAALARNGDEASQRQIHTFLAHEKLVYEATTRAANIKYAQAMDRASGALANGASPGPSPGQPAPPDNNPYSYLTPGGH